LRRGQSTATNSRDPRCLITERAIRRNSFTSVRELKQQIELFVQRYNADATPFQWVATADQSCRRSNESRSEFLRQDTS
jgi:hypothetical protein